MSQKKTKEKYSENTYQTHEKKGAYTSIDHV